MGSRAACSFILVCKDAPDAPPSWPSTLSRIRELGSGVLSRIVVLAESGGCAWDLRRLVRVFSLARIFFNQKMRGRPPHLLGENILANENIRITRRKSL